MILVPAFDPSNISITDKIEFATSNQELYNSLTGSEVPVAFINFILPGYMDDKPALNATLISPNLISAEMVKGYYDKDLSLYINYFGSPEDIRERLHMYDHDLIIQEKIISPSWNINVYIPLHSIESTYNKSKFNLNYGLSLVGEEVNLINVQKYAGQGVTHFNLNFMDINTTMSYIEAKAPLLKELGTKFPEAQFIICAKDARTLKLPENFKVVVGTQFWNDLIH
jgi:hypothetical protein